MGKLTEEFFENGILTAPGAEVVGALLEAKISETALWREITEMEGARNPSVFGVDFNMADIEIGKDGVITGLASVLATIDLPQFPEQSITISNRTFTITPEMDVRFG